MSPTGNKIPTNSHISANPPFSHSYKEASTSQWQLQVLFQSFLEGQSADIMLAVQERRLLISWDLKAIHCLRGCLRTWILDQIPGDAVGAFLVIVLYEQDFHLDYRLTVMVREGQSQLHIARRLLAFYLIRDEAGVPIWDHVTVYAADARLETSSQIRRVSGRSNATKELPPRIPTPPPTEVRWPFFMSALSDPKLEDFMDKLGDEGQLAEDDLPPLFTGVREEDIPIIQAFRRFNLHKNDSSQDIPITESGPDRIEYTSNQTNKLQDEHLSPISMKTLSALPIGKALSNGFPLPLPPLSRPRSPNPSSVRVTTFKPEKKPKYQQADYISSQNANIEQREGKTDLCSSPASRPKPTAPVNVNQDALHASDIASPPSPPKLKKKAGVEDLRKARERSA